MNDSNHQLYVTALTDAYPWLTTGEAGEVAGALEREVIESGTFPSSKEAMLAMGNLLDAMGLMATPTLLLQLAGKGSKTTAGQVAASVARTRFEQSCLNRTSKIETPSNIYSEVKTPAITDLEELASLVASKIQLPSVQTVALPASIDGIEKIMAAIAGISGELSWLKSTIDTERQLRRYQDKMGTLEEPGAKNLTETDRRAVIANLGQNLAKSYYNQRSPSGDLADAPQE